MQSRVQVATRVRGFLTFSDFKNGYSCKSVNSIFRKVALFLNNIIWIISQKFLGNCRQLIVLLRDISCIISGETEFTVLANTIPPRVCHQPIVSKVV